MRERLDYVDGLRAVAVLSVIAFHSGVSNAVLAPQNTLLTLLLKQGCHGVDLFFVVSGFCLSYPVLKKVYDQGFASFDICSYLARRVLRIAPPYYAALAVMLLLFAVFSILHIPLLVSMRGPHAYDFDKIVAQMLFLDGGSAYANGSFWTLCVEFRWYLVFPALLWLWVRSPKAFALTGAALVVAYSVTRLNALDVATLPAFMFGIFAAHIRLRPGKIVKWLPVIAVAGFLAGIRETPEDWKGYLTFPTEIAAFGLFVAGGHTAVLRRTLEMAWLTAIGRYSYGIYLIHQPVVDLVNRLLSRDMSATALLPVAALAGIAAGFAFSQIFEQPLLHGALRRRALDALEPVIRRLWASMPGERGIELTRLAPPERNKPVIIAV